MKKEETQDQDQGYLELNRDRSSLSFDLPLTGLPTEVNGEKNVSRCLLYIFVYEAL